MRTFQKWISEHPHINVLVFEKNYDKEFGFGALEEVCGFCLASHFFDDEPPKICHFCRAPIRETHTISDLPEITSRKYVIAVSTSATNHASRPSLFIVKRKPKEKAQPGLEFGKLDGFAGRDEKRFHIVCKSLPFEHN